MSTQILLDNLNKSPPLTQEQLHTVQEFIKQTRDVERNERLAPWLVDSLRNR